MRSLLPAVLVWIWAISFSPAGAFAQYPLRLFPGEESDVGDNSAIKFESLLTDADPALDGSTSRIADPEEIDLTQLQKRIELQQRQLQTLEKITQSLAEELERQGQQALPGDDLQNQAAMLESRAAEAARRDRQLADAIDDLNEQFDARERSGTELPGTLRELYLPSRTNESPLSIFGTLATGFQDFEDKNSSFTSPVFSPHFYLLLNERFLLEANPEFQGHDTDLESAQLDWFATDHLTFVLGRFYSPLGFFTERIHASWINKLPDRPLMFSQVFPSPLSQNGVMARGARYVADSPLKLEYATFVANGLSLDNDDPDADDFADLHEMTETVPDVNDSKAIGGRIGLSLPETGWIVGLSGLANGDYDVADRHNLTAWIIDANLHRGNWDFRFEFAQTNQETPGADIDRHGFYAQAAYRPYDLYHPYVQKLEGVVRFDYVRFGGIDLAQTGTDFGASARIPFDRNRYTAGINYYPYPSLVLKLAYQISDEVDVREIADDGVMAQVAWGW